ncbi:hypothetical protein BDR06DRAFT_1072554 [Suillus hirtellus]|nr:hypothetical protein BDR06DRAFT_1072554 [Suillus hirtellus]
MQYIATLVNPWEVPSKLACQKLQVIWDAISPTSHTQSRAQAPCISYSAAIAIIIAYLESQETLKHSDDNHVEFATYALDKLHFLYKKANSDDKSKFRGLYQGAFMVQMFGTHFTAINGARKIHGLEKLGDNLNPVGGLALSCAATLNHSTGKVSNHQMGFNDVTWGSSTCSYEFSKKSHCSGNNRAVNDAVDDEDLDERAQLVDILESESGSEDSDHTIGSDVE